MVELKGLRLVYSYLMSTANPVTLKKMKTDWNRFKNRVDEIIICKTAKQKLISKAMAVENKMPITENVTYPNEKHESNHVHEKHQGIFVGERLVGNNKNHVEDIENRFVEETIALFLSRHCDTA